MEAASSGRQAVQNLPEPVEDFLRNFLRRSGLNRTLSSFETEWYRSGKVRRLHDASFLLDAQTQREVLLRELDSVRQDTQLLREEVLRTAQTLVRVQREMDFHRLQHYQVTGQNQYLTENRKQLKAHLESCKSAVTHLEVLRDRNVLRVQRHRSKQNQDQHRGQVQTAPGSGPNRTRNRSKQNQ